MVEKVGTDNKDKNMYIMNQYTYSTILFYLDLFRERTDNLETKKNIEILIRSLRRA